MKLHLSEVTFKLILFCQQNNRVNVAYKTSKLKDLVSTTQKKAFASRNQNYNLGVVYHLQCKLCQPPKTDYIGEIGRLIQQKLNEHFTTSQKLTKCSERASHALLVRNSNVPANWTLRILAYNKDEISRKIEESKEIIKFQTDTQQDN